jgi:hypothetical protein
VPAHIEILFLIYKTYLVARMEYQVTIDTIIKWLGKKICGNMINRFDFIEADKVLCDDSMLRTEIKAIDAAKITIKSK